MCSWRSQVRHIYTSVWSLRRVYSVMSIYTCVLAFMSLFNYPAKTLGFHCSPVLSFFAAVLSLATVVVCVGHYEQWGLKLSRSCWSQSWSTAVTCEITKTQKWENVSQEMECMILEPVETEEEGHARCVQEELRCYKADQSQLLRSTSTRHSVVPFLGR